MTSTALFPGLLGDDIWRQLPDAVQAMHGAAPLLRANGLADVTGADLRGADVSGADLRTTLFLTQPQIDSARGDAATRLPPARRRPMHWRN